MKNRMNKKGKELMSLLLLLIGLMGYGQIQLKSITIDKSYDQQFKTSLKLQTLVKNEQPFFRLNMGASKIMEMKDNLGYDLLGSGVGLLQEESYASYNDFDSTLDLWLVFDSAPSTGATTLNVKGTFIIEYVKEGNQEFRSNLSMPGNNYQSINQNEMGEIRISGTGSATVGEAEYNIYSIEGPYPINSLEVANDDTEEYTKLGLGLDSNQFVFKKEPEAIEVNIIFSDVEQIEIPLEISFGIGM